MQVAMHRCPEALSLAPLLKDIACPRQTLKIAYPCTGVKASGFFEEAWGLRTVSCHVYDLEPDYAALYDSIFGAGKYCVGPDHGDLLKIKLQDLEVPNFLIAGPPCPPWAGNGLKRGESDARADVYGAILKWIVHWSRHPQFLGFALENVGGMAKRNQGCEAYLPRALKTLRAAVPTWIFDFVTLSLQDYKLPQSRTRVFLRGMPRALVTDMIPPPLDGNLLEPKTLQDCLIQGLPCTKRDSLISNRKKNLKNFEFQLRVARKKNELGATSIAVCSIDRSSEATWQSSIQYDRIPTLTTSNVFLFMISTDDLDAPDDQKKLFRFLHPLERLLLQGLPVQKGDKLGNEKLIVKAAGNCYPPVLVAAAIAPMLALVPSDFIVDPAEIKYAPSHAAKTFRVPTADRTAMKGKAAMKTVGAKGTIKRMKAQSGMKAIGAR